MGEEWEPCANILLAIRNLCKYSKRQNKPLNLMATAQTWALSEVTNKQNTSVPPQLLMGFLLLGQRDPETQNIVFPSQVLVRQSEKYCLGAFSLAYETKLLGRNIQKF